MTAAKAGMASTYESTATGGASEATRPCCSASETTPTLKRPRFVPHAHDAADVALFTQHAADAITVERELHASLLSELAVAAHADAVLNIEAGPATTAYIDHLLATCATGSFSDGLATVLPCYWIYAQVGEHLLAQSSPDPLYARWISTYGGPAFADTVGAVLDVVDRIGEHLSATSAQRAEHLYTVGARHEWMFWDAAWTHRGWPTF